MKLMRCVSRDKMMPTAIVVGNQYWIDVDDSYTYFDGDKFVDVYIDKDKRERLGTMNLCHFSESAEDPIKLCNYVNNHRGLPLKDIISWCKDNPTTSLSQRLTLYIRDNKLDVEENMEKEFLINSVPYRAFAERGRSKEYERYLGLSLYTAE